jgi:glycosyltransferase involved in cell wall biosynthesis
VKIGFYSPLPPARTGVAEYSSALKRALETGDTQDTVEVNAAQADAFLYHLGNNQLHARIYEQALKKPGVAVLHDAVLHHFMLGSLDQERYVSEFAFNYGEWSRDLAQGLWRGRACSATEARYFEYPMLKRIAEVSRALIVHNPGAAAMVRLHAPAAVVHEIPHLFDPPAPVPGYETEYLRARLGVQPGALLLGVFGHLRESKRLAAVLRVFRRLRTTIHAQLLICGSFASSDLERALEPDLQQEGVLRAGYFSDDSAWWRHAAAVDACINLRFPAAGETSGIAVRLMGIGKPVIVSAGVETSRFPEATCIRVETGEAEEDMLADVLCWLARHREDAQLIGARAAEYVGRVHALDSVAGLYRKYLRNCYDKE